MSALINYALKSVIQRPRPSFYPLLLESDYSFPSGHSMDSFVFYATLAYLVFHFTGNKEFAVVCSAFSIVLIIAIGISRIYLGVHYPTDVLAGYLGGLGWFTSVILIQKTLIFYKLFKEKHKKLSR